MKGKGLSVDMAAGRILSKISNHDQESFIEAPQKDSGIDIPGSSIDQGCGWMWGSSKGLIRIALE